MAEAYVHRGELIIPLDQRNYSCLVSANGMHDWDSQAGTVVFCNECGRVA